MNKSISPAPVWKDNYTAIAMSSSDEYVPYLSVCLQSLKNHASASHRYDILVFERSITLEHKQILLQQMQAENISLRFVNPMPVLKSYDLKFPPHYNLECYFRLTTPLILPDYSKIIFTDVDLIFQRDIQQLYHTPLDKGLAACQDLVWDAFCDNPKKNEKNYALTELELKNPYMYFNTGVLLLNLDYFRQHDVSRQLLEMANAKMYRILEQDILNKFFKENIVYLKDYWNFPTLNASYAACMQQVKDPSISQRYQQARQEAAIVHWAGAGKAWNDPEADLAYKWWMVARQTPFYEEILNRLFFKGVQSLAVQTKEAFLYPTHKIEYSRASLLACLTWGKKKTHYETKKGQLKHRLNVGKILR